MSVIKTDTGEVIDVIRYFLPFLYVHCVKSAN